ncbi:MAG: alanine racemase [Alphaproteobacteria bacterium]|nr:alanine racemase [Alphaproteobacteria bacterium]
MSQQSVLRIDLDAIAANWTLLDRHAERAEVGAVVKANGYGLGIEPVAKALHAAGARRFFVATLNEGVILRSHLAAAEIVVLNGVLAGDEELMVSHDLLPALNDPGMVRRWRDAARTADRRLPAYLQIDSGMTRLGLDRPGIEALASDPEAFDGLDIRFAMTHCAVADTPDHPGNAKQLSRFRAALARFPGLRASMAASSAIFLGDEYHFDLVRPGAALYGVRPIDGEPNPMRQVVQLEATILQVRAAEAGDAVGYGATRILDRDSRIATVACGYADGFTRLIGEAGSARIGAFIAPIVGRISMDLITLDVTDLPETAVLPGQRATLIGDHFDINDAADAARTIGYEVLTGLGHRFFRVYEGGAA